MSPGSERAVARHLRVDLSGAYKDDNSVALGAQHSLEPLLSVRSRAGQVADFARVQSAFVETRRCHALQHQFILVILHEQFVCSRNTGNQFNTHSMHGE